MSPRDKSSETNAHKTKAHTEQGSFTPKFSQK